MNETRRPPAPFGGLTRTMHPEVRPLAPAPPERGVRYAGENLVFLVGAARSGTTWLQRLLACHPLIRTGQETHLFAVNIGPQLRAYRSYADPKHRGGVGLACYFTEPEFLSILRTYMLTLLEPIVGSLRRGEVFLEKTPNHARFIPEILELLPRSRVIHILRDPRDVVASMTAASHAWGASWAPRDPRAAARVWVNDIGIVRKASRGLPGWQFLEVRYEELHRAPVDVLRRCAEWLSLAWDRAAIEEAVEANDFREAQSKGGGTPIPVGGAVAKRSGDVVTEPEGFLRRGQAGGWRTDLSVVDKYRIWRVLRRPMSEMGYAWPFFWSS